MKTQGGPQEDWAGEPILFVNRLSLDRGRKRVHRDLNVSFSAGVTVILGPNGVGKTTFLEGLLEPASVISGSVTLNGWPSGDSSRIGEYYAAVGYMPQAWKYVGSFTALESVEYAAWLKGVPSRSLRDAAKIALDSVNLTGESATKVRKLSGGMRQRVGLAEAFVNDPRVVLLDEPTVGLDPAQRAAYRGFLVEKSADRAVILSSHLTDDVAATANRVLVMTDRGISFDGSPNQLADLADHVKGAASALEAGYLTVVGK